MEHYILFTGHMIDRADRAIPRFPATLEDWVGKQIGEKLLSEQKRAGRQSILKGIAGGACGGDILFHEACRAMDMASEMILPMPPESFKAASVNFAGADWSRRFDALYGQIPHVILDEEVWTGYDTLVENAALDIWSRCNLWMLDKALSNGGVNMTLIALWNGKDGDGPGGTSHMIPLAREAGAGILIISI